MWIASFLIPLSQNGYFIFIIFLVFVLKSSELKINNNFSLKNTRKIIRGYKYNSKIFDDIV